MSARAGATPNDLIITSVGAAAFKTGMRVKRHYDRVAPCD